MKRGRRRSQIFLWWGWLGGRREGEEEESQRERETDRQEEEEEDRGRGKVRKLTGRHSMVALC